jgi:hypothetical protein
LLLSFLYFTSLFHYVVFLLHFSLFCFLLFHLFYLFLFSPFPLRS